MTDKEPPLHDPIQVHRRCNDGHEAFQLWIRAFMKGSPDTKYLREKYNAHLETCPLCKKADKPR